MPCERATVDARAQPWPTWRPPPSSQPWSSAISLAAIARVEWPAFNSSNQLHALTTVGQFVCLVGLFAGGWLWRTGRRLIARIASVVFLSALSAVTLAMPLGATKLYLFGVSVDQQFRTEYLTRLTDTVASARHDLHRSAAVLSARLVLAGRQARRPDRHAGLGDVQAVVDHLDHRRDRRRVRVVGGHDSLRAGAGGGDGDRRRHAGLRPRRAVRRDHHGAAAAGVRAGVVGAAGRLQGAAAGRPSSASASSSGGGAVLHTAARLRGVHARRHGASHHGRQATLGSAAPGRRHRRDRGGDRPDRLGTLPARRVEGRARPTPAPPSTTFPPTAPS